MMKLLVVCVLLIYVGKMEVYSECCYNVLGICADGSTGTPCCGKLECNIFCCGCDSCRNGDAWPWGRRKRDVSGVMPPNGFEIMDKNENGHVDKDEAHSHLLSGSCGNFTGDFAEFEMHFTKFDKDGDGKLNYTEINAAG